MPTSQELALLDLSSNELDRIIGEAVVAGEFGAKDMSDAEKQERAQLWFARHRDDFRARHLR